MNNPKIDSYGTKHWLNEQGLPHRTDGPAIEFANGYKEWWINGLLHREDGPAVECRNGDKHWFTYGKLIKVEYPKCDPVIAFHFTEESWKLRNPCLNDKNELVTHADFGQTLIHPREIELCKQGLHASRKITQAFYYAPGFMLHRVLCEGGIKEQYDKLVCQKRTILWSLDLNFILQKLSNYKLDYQQMMDARFDLPFFSEEQIINEIKEYYPELTFE